MTTYNLAAVLSICGIVAVTTGCGSSSGSTPMLPPEVRFEVSPAAGAQPPFEFQVEPCDPLMSEPCGLLTDGVRHNVLTPGTTDPLPFTAIAPLSFILENALPPYSGTFRQLGNTAITVHLVQEGTGIETSQTTSGIGTTITVSILGQPLPATFRSPEVRFDVCSQPIGALPCSVNNPSGSAGQEFTGSIGDPFTTYLIGRATTTNPSVQTPAVFFFEGARDTINAGFTGFNSASLTARMFINGQLRSSGSGTGDLNFRLDF